jgi:hypothetical protein
VLTEFDLGSAGNTWATAIRDATRTNGGVNIICDDETTDNASWVGRALETVVGSPPYWEFDYTEGNLAAVLETIPGFNRVPFFGGGRY